MLFLETRFAISTCTGPPGCRYADHLLPGGTAKNRPSAVDFGRQRPIEGEIGSIEREQGKKKKRKRRKKKRRKRKPSVVIASAPSPPSATRRRRASALARSPARRQNVSPRGEEDQGNRYARALPSPCPLDCGLRHQGGGEEKSFDCGLPKGYKGFGAFAAFLVTTSSAALATTSLDPYASSSSKEVRLSSPLPPSS
ncbi:hypothetical protein GW17_00001451 [Ensete ventricosum]|nr:hypothetical protein GW17_00001451 [Ensete ventricosum]RZR90996.1 hypothetical protein BHM03_00019027 [Ensete ventricosum]